MASPGEGERPSQPTRRSRRILLGAATAVVVITVITVTGYVIGLKSGQTTTTTTTTAAGSPPATSTVPAGFAVSPPVVDPGALPPDGPPSPARPMRQTSYCTKMDVLPGTDFRVPPKYMDLLDLPGAWKFGRGAGVTVAIIDTGVSPHHRLPHLVGGGDYVTADGDGLSDCDGRGTLVASLIAGAPSQADAFSGVAPAVEVISIRQSSQAFRPTDPPPVTENPDTRQKTDSIQTMARAIVHAANLGASVINISDVLCVSARDVLDQRALAAAIAYAAVDKNAVIVAAAGDTSRRGCRQNPLRPNDSRDWTSVNTVVTPAWFSDYVLTVGAVDSAGAPLSQSSVAGPWVSIAAPGTDIEGLSPRDDGLVNAVDGPDNSLLVPSGTGFSAAIVSGAAALVRAKYPQLSAHQIINRLIRTARAPTGGVDNQVGYGVVDPVAALTKDVPG